MMTGTVASGRAFLPICVIFIGSFLFSCKAQVYNQNLLYSRLETEIGETKTKDKPLLQCYDCNSEYDPRCGDPFNPYTIGIINCTDRKTPNHLRDPQHLDIDVPPVVCRKMTQKVEGNIRVIRGCGYIRDEHDDKRCYRRTGTANVEVIHCACTKSLCNTAQSIQNLHSALRLGAILAITNILSRLV